jgi:alginate O-acetyltransferase complex protein AlgI
MLFNSFEFLMFLPIVFLLYWFVFNKNLNWQNGLVLVASYFFYGWWSWKFMGLLMLSTTLDYAYGFWVASPNRKKAKFFLWLSIINNLGILGIFKYYNFFAVQLQKGFDLIGLHTNPILLQVALPIGISFYTFHGMSYVFDIYRGNQKPVINIIEYAVFVSFFPLLVAGPIERANHLLPQVQKPRFFRHNQATEGFKLILWGMFKKIVIADSLSLVVDEIFQNYQNHHGGTLIIGAIAFSFQIYGDFSGYSDIALGTSKLFGFELLNNFKFPYFSRDIAEFWRRWHISLSSWFKDYVYFPLGGSKNGKYTAIRNTFIIFMLSGFWHGASWNFIAWGFIHACGFLPLLLLNKNRKYLEDNIAQNSYLPTFSEFIKIIWTFIFVTLAWIFFRSPNLTVSLNYLRIIFSPTINYFNIDYFKYTSLMYIPLLLALDYNIYKQKKNHVIWYYIYTISSIIALISSNNPSFLYFQF